MSSRFLKLHKIITVQVFKVLIFWCKGNSFSEIVMGVFFSPKSFVLNVINEKSGGL